MPTERKTKCEQFSDWIKSPSCAIFANYFLGSWGDRMWHFAAGLYLVYLANNSLRLAAIFGFASGGLALLFGGIIGNWVDKNGRMKVVRISLFMQNTCVALCATCVCLVLIYEKDVKVLLDGHLKGICETLIIIFGLIASLASIAYKIAIEKDWIVVVASGNRGKLTNLNAVTRAIDLLCKILAPTTAGLIMSYASMTTAAIVIAGWNVVSVFVEYALLHRVYLLVPSLATKTGELDNAMNDDSNKSRERSVEEAETDGQKDLPETDKLLENTSNNDSNKNRKKSVEEAETDGQKDLPETDKLLENNSPAEDEQSVVAKSEVDKPHDDDLDAENEAEITQPLEQQNGNATEEDHEVVEEKTKKTCLQMMFDPFVTLVRGWKTYMKQRIVFAGLALSFLYMTVLGFDSVTLGYIYANDVDEVFVGLTMAMAGVTGIIGTFAFTRISRRIGLERTGLMAFNTEIVCLSLCVMSVFTPGTHFDPTFQNPSPNCSKYLPDSSMTTAPFPDSPMNLSATQAGIRARRSISYSDPLKFATIAYPSASHQVDALAFRPGLLEDGERHIEWLMYEDYGLSPHSVKKRAIANPDEMQNMSDVTTAETSPSDVPAQCQPGFINVSIILFLLGIVTSRVGLWMADLVVTQLMQENVAERERGIVNGVQNSLNMMMDMFKFTLVIALPKIPTFGILIILSFTFICAAGCFFAFHSWRERGHLFHFDKVAQCITHKHQNGNATMNGNGHQNGTVASEQKQEPEVV